MTRAGFRALRARWQHYETFTGGREMPWLGRTICIFRKKHRVELVYLKAEHLRFNEALCAAKENGTRLDFEWKPMPRVKRRRVGNRTADAHRRVVL